MSKSIHIVSFDIPFPANYGGVIDVYYKLVWLHKMGVKIHLHCWEYGRAHARELETICEKVYYYKRNTSFINQLSLTPFTVKSRISEELKSNLQRTDAPVLFEVLHTCFLLKDPAFRNRIKIYRHSNIEHDYYASLARSEKKLFKKLYLFIEAFKLKTFEPIIDNANYILAVNEKDASYFSSRYKSPKTIYLPSFHSNSEINIKKGTGEFILFHGNLSVPENIVAVEWLIKNVFSKIQHKIIIAGLKPDRTLEALIKKYNNIELIANPDESQMEELIQNAHVHALYTDQATGLKLKLLNVLFKGRHIICNKEMTEGTSMTPNASLIIANTAEEYRMQLNECMKKKIEDAFISERRDLCKNFDNYVNINTILKLLD